MAGGGRGEEEPTISDPGLSYEEGERRRKIRATSINGIGGIKMIKKQVRSSLKPVLFLFTIAVASAGYYNIRILIFPIRQCVLEHSIV